MAFGAPSSGFASLSGASAPSAGGPQVQKGPDLLEIHTEALGFRALNGEAKVRLLQTPWPDDSLPPITSSLLSVAPKKGLVAAVGPDALVLASTDSVRGAFEADGDNIKPFTPQLTMPMDTRISQLTFTADGELLVISAELGGGLAIYETQELVKGNTKSSFELPTGGKPIRSLVPNPAEDSAGLLAIVTTNGELMMLDATRKTFINGAAGQVLREGVSCVSWSNKGKQLVAGLGNGSAHQMTPDGVGKAEIPRPPDLQGDQHVSSIAWLQDHVFFTVHTPCVADDTGPAPPSEYHLIQGKPQTENFTVQRLPEVCAPYGLNRSPSFQFIQRLRNFLPDLNDILIVASTSAEDIGLFTRSSKPLTSDVPAEQIFNTFTATTLGDARRAALPMASDMTTNTSVIGMALDLSSKSKVPNPIPGEELEESSGPLPALLLLNHQGILSGWWFVYNDSVTQGTTYPGLVVAGGSQLPQSQTSAAPAFGSTIATIPSKPAFPQTSAFGSSSSAFGGSSFGAPAALGSKSSPWGPTASSTASNSTPAFGQPAFGSSSIGTQSQTPAFGSSGGLGVKASPWASTNQSSATAGASFGQASAMGAQRPSAFGATAQNPTAQPTLSKVGSTGGFASFAGSGGFASVASNTASGASALNQAPAASPFSSSKDSGPILGAQITTDNTGGGMFGAPKQGFSIGTSWTNSNAGKSNENQLSEQKGSSMFSSGFASALNETPKETTPISKETDMMSDDEDTSPPRSPAAAPATQSTTQSTTPQAKPNLFGTQRPLTGTTSLFGQTSHKPATTPLKDQIQISPQQSGASIDTTNTPASVSPVVKSEPTNEGSAGVDKDIPEAPLPPETVSKASYTPGTSSTSSVGASKTSLEEPPLPPDPFQNPSTSVLEAALEEPPLPPDPFQKPVSQSKSLFGDAPQPPDPTSKMAPSKPAPADPREKATGPEPSVPEHKSDGQEALPESDDGDLDDEGSGVDVAQELSSVAEPTPEQSPQSSFALKTSGNSAGSSFEKVPSLSKESSKSLFGEISKPPIPTFEPVQRVQASPRSPSPVRIGARNALRADPSRSVSAPGIPLRSDGVRKVTMGRPAQPASIYPPAFEDYTHREEKGRLATQKAYRQAEEEQELSDYDNSATREILDSEVHASLELEAFTAHTGELAPVMKQGLPGQIELVYRDINSMINCFGINARALDSFIRGHEELSYNQARSRADLEQDELWTLGEIEDLGYVIEALEEDLEAGRLQDHKAMIHECQDLSRELSRLKAKSNDIKYSVNAKNDPQLLESLRTAPLSTEQSTIRHELRSRYTEFQRMLTQTEEAVSMLKAKLAGLQAMSSKAKGAAKVPTVEAVEKTILKMTTMFEKRSGDIDLLETQMRKLNIFNSPAPSREASPFVTPSSHKKGTMPITPGSSVNGRSFYTPGSRGSVFAASSGASGRKYLTPGKKIASAADEEAQAYAAKAARKRHIRVLLKEALTSGEPIVRTLDEL